MIGARDPQSVAMLAFGEAPAQGSRLLRLHTPLGADVLLAERLELLEEIGPQQDTPCPAGLLASVQALALDTHLPLKRLIGQPVLLQLARADASLRGWHGHVSAAELLGSDGGLARYRLQIEPWLSFLGHRQDSWVFQQQSVVEIVESVFSDYSGQGRLAPCWRWDLADAAVYPRRSLCIQHRESDLAFVQRLLREEGLFCWWEHEGRPQDEGLGLHRLVIADHNGAFTDELGTVRFTQAGAGLAHDSLDRLRRGRRVATAELQKASPDYRSLGLRPTSQIGASPVPGLGTLMMQDIGGQYAWPDAAQGERLALRQMQALDAWRESCTAGGTLRDAAPGARLLLSGHAVHDGLDTGRDRFFVLAVRHRAHSNWGATAAEAEEPLYRCELELQRLSLPARPATLGELPPDVRLHPRPTAHGVQTALVVGLGEPVHTDRDHRVKIQFHWQRGSRSSHRLCAPSGDCNAPASDASGTWVRVAAAWAGANWGHHFVPRLGQEVLVGFVGGDIDRPVVLGALYNGRGEADAPHNCVAAGAARACGAAPAWFPGVQAEGHRHGAVLAGIKSQELASSASGIGGCNQLVFDDSPGAARLELSSSCAASRLQLGHLLHQDDNRRLQPRGHGLDLGSEGWGALRAGRGLLISAHRSGDGGSHVAAREPGARLAQARELMHALTDSARRQSAGVGGEPAALPAERALDVSEKSLQAFDRCGDPGDAAVDPERAIGGGHGSSSAWRRPDLVLAAPAGIGMHTPASQIGSAGQTLSLVADQQLNLVAQGHHSLMAKAGLVLYTCGQADPKTKEITGIALHAASGSVSSQSLQGATRLIADKAVDVQSTTAMVRVTAPVHVLLAAAGAAIELKGSDITLKAPGRVEFRAAMKEWAAAGHAAAALALRKSGSFSPRTRTPGQFKTRHALEQLQAYARDVDPTWFVLCFAARFGHDIPPSAYLALHDHARRGVLENAEHRLTAGDGVRWHGEEAVVDVGLALARRAAAGDTDAQWKLLSGLLEAFGGYLDLLLRTQFSRTGGRATSGRERLRSPLMLDLEGRAETPFAELTGEGGGPIAASHATLQKAMRRADQVSSQQERDRHDALAHARRHDGIYRPERDGQAFSMRPVFDAMLNDGELPSGMFNHGLIEQKAFRDVRELTAADVAMIYYGNWLRDMSQVLCDGFMAAPGQPGSFKEALSLNGVLSRETLTLLLIAAGEVRFTQQLLQSGAPADYLDFIRCKSGCDADFMRRVGTYRPEEHIDNPVGLPAAYSYELPAGWRVPVPVPAAALGVNPRSHLRSYIDTTVDAEHPCAVDYLCAQIAEAARHGKTAAGLMHLGNALHVLEDFFAHTNFIELSLHKLGHREVIAWVPTRSQLTEMPVVTGVFEPRDSAFSMTYKLADILFPLTRDAKRQGARLIEGMPMVDWIKARLLDESGASHLAAVYRQYSRACVRLSGVWEGAVPELVRQAYERMQVDINHVLNGGLKRCAQGLLRERQLQQFQHGTSLDPSHTLIAKDGTDHPLHTLAAELAAHAASAVGGLMQTVWEGGVAVTAAQQSARAYFVHPANSAVFDDRIRQWAASHAPALRTLKDPQALRARSRSHGHGAPAGSPPSPHPLGSQDWVYLSKHYEVLAGIPDAWPEDLA